MASTSKNRKAFILDASEENASWTQRLLAEQGIEVKEWARSGTGWIAQWQKFKPELMIIDYTLPKRDGLYCLEKSHELSAHCLTIFTHSFVGMVGNDLELKAMARGAFGVFQRPGHDDRFRRLLRHAHHELDGLQSLKKLKVPSPG